MPPRIITRLILAALAIAIAPAIGAADLSYAFRFVKEPAPAIQVDVRFNLTVEGPKELVLPNEYGGEREMWRWVSNLEVVEGAATLGPGELPFLRRITVHESGPCLIRYVVRVPTEALTRGVYRRPVLRENYVHLLGNTFLVQPRQDVRKAVPVEMSWDLPPDWKVGNSFGAGQTRQQFSATPVELVQSVYVAGDFRFERRDVQGRPVVAASRGKWGFADADFAALLQGIVGTQRELWQDHAFPFYFVSLLPVDIPRGSTSGTGRWNGFAAFLPEGAPIDDKLRHLLAHELFHTWIPGKLFGAFNLTSEMYWFSEGFTEYYAHVTLLLSGQRTFEKFLETLNSILGEYASSPVRNMPNKQAGREYFTNDQAGRLAYLRGLLVALNWNAAIRQASGGERSLNDLVRGLRTASGDGARAVNLSMLAGEAQRLGVADAAKQAAAWIERGETVEVRPDSLGPCAEPVAAESQTPRFQLKAGAGRCDAWFR